jgi:3-phenylpropionate/cinnamic acid dioxygenase small subunit
VSLNTTIVSAEPALGDVAAFLHHEARLLDEHRLEEWLNLFLPDGHYWMPASWNQLDPLDHLSLYYEDMDLLKVRVARIRHPRTETMKPPPRSAHIIGNVAIDRFDPETHEVFVYSTFSLVEYRLDEQRLFAGHCRHRLQVTKDGLRIALKRVDILNCDSERGHIRFNIPI